MPQGHSGRLLAALPPGPAMSGPQPSAGVHCHACAVIRSQESTHE